MLIDWFTVGAQALNFLILVWLMKRFLYKPILDAIAARETKIAAELAAADEKKADAQKEHDAFTENNTQFDQQRAGLLTKATDAANAEGKRIVDEARKSADEVTAKGKDALRADAKTLTIELARRTQDEVFAIARKTLADLATTSLEERMGDAFTRRLRAMDGDAKSCLAGAIHTASGPVLIQSAFEVPAEQRANIQKAVNETFAADVHLSFETAPDVVSGIELTANGQKVAWSIAGYLTAMEKGISDVLEAKTA